MKYTKSLLLSFSLVVGVFALARPLGAQDSAAKSSAINYNFDNSALDRSNKSLLSSYSDMLDQVTPGVVGVYPSSKINPDTITLSGLSAGGRRGGGFGGPGGGAGNLGNGPGNGGGAPLGGVPAPGATGGGRRGGRAGGSLITQFPPNHPDWSDANSTDYWFMGVGSGCIISSDGYILTNHHVIEDNVVPTGNGANVTVTTDAVLVKLPDGREFPAKVIGSDESTDLALLKIDAKNLPTIKMADSDKLKVGDIVFAIGNPMDVGLTVTHGIISAIGRSQVASTDDSADTKVHVENFIQTDASINEGNSGGPLVDAQGRLIGLNSEILSASRAGGSIGIGFAVPSNLARHVADDLTKEGKVSHGGLGVTSQEIDHNLAQVLGIAN
ncbi:MAG TPA: trypsin-like peptidase domain-containing protein, partial [Opitutales bacterium]|nr:trypsin-like peptidase domain-containing protein [Opitutales bacterium]